MKGNPPTSPFHDDVDAEMNREINIGLKKIDKAIIQAETDNVTKEFDMNAENGQSGHDCQHIQMDKGSTSRLTAGNACDNKQSLIDKMKGSEGGNMLTLPWSDGVVWSSFSLHPGATSVENHNWKPPQDPMNDDDFQTPANSHRHRDTQQTLDFDQQEALRIAREQDFSDLTDNDEALPQGLDEHMTQETPGQPPETPATSQRTQKLPNDMATVFLSMIRDVTNQLTDLQNRTSNLSERQRHAETYPEEHIPRNDNRSSRLPHHVPTFEGREDENLELWEYTVRTAFQSSDIPRSKWTCHATSLLRGVAAQWAYNVTRDREVLPDWVEWIGLLRDIFTDKTSQHELRNKLDQLKQDGSIREYTHKFLATLGQI
jgi:hypothetical protein